MRHYSNKPQNIMDTTELFDVSYRVPHLMRSAEEISPINVESTSTLIITKGLVNRDIMGQECVYGE